MRVLFLAYANFGEHSGGTRHMIELLNALADIGVDVSLAVPKMWLPKEGVRFRLVPYLCPDVRFVRAVWSRLAMAFIAARAGVRDRVDILYARDPNGGWLYALPARIAGVPLVIQVVGFVDEQSVDSREGRLHHLFVSVGQRLTIALANRIIATSDGIRSRLIADFDRAPDDVATVPRGIDLEAARPLDSADCRARLGIDGDPVIMYVGSIIPWQGIETAIASMPQVLARHPRARLVVVGPRTSFSASLTTQVAGLGLESSVSFPGGVPFERAVDYINAADVCLAPYADAMLMKRGPVSDKLLTYLACGKPVVCSAALRLHAPDVERLDLGAVCKPDDVDDLAAAIGRVLDRRRAFVLRTGELRRYAEGWSWPPRAASTQAFLADACRSAR